MHSALGLNCLCQLPPRTPSSMPRPVQQTVKGRWAAGTAGGCPKVASWTKNPQYVLKPIEEAGGTFTITLRCAASPRLDIGFVVLTS